MKNIIYPFSLLFMISPLVFAAPPYLGVSVGQNISITDNACVSVAKTVLANEGFAKIVQYGGSATLFAADLNSDPYDYKVVVKCLSDKGTMIVVAVANDAKNAKKKAARLRHQIQQGSPIKTVSVQSASVSAVPPYLGISVGETALSNRSCVSIAEQALEDEGFEQIEQYKNHATLFAAYQNSKPYQYKAVVKCLSEPNLVAVVAAANVANNAKKKADQLRRQIQNYRGNLGATSINKPLPNSSEENDRNTATTAANQPPEPSQELARGAITASNTEPPKPPKPEFSTLLQQEFRQNNLDKRIIIETKPIGDSFADGVVIKGSLLVNNETSWQVESASDNLIEIGHYGLAPTARFVQIGPDNYGVLFDEHATQMGEFSRILFLVAAVGEQMKIVFSLEDAGKDNLAIGCGNPDIGRPECYSYDTQLEFVPGDNPDYFDIQAITTGTVQKSELFSFNGDKYE